MCIHTIPVTVFTGPFRPNPVMSPDTRILNLTRNCLIERGQAKKRIAAGVMTWVSPGRIVRETTLSEQREQIAHRAYLESPLPISEVYGCVYEPPARDRTIAKLSERRQLLGQALAFCREASCPA